MRVEGSRGICLRLEKLIPLSMDLGALEGLQGTGRICACVSELRLLDLRVVRVGYECERALISRAVRLGERRKGRDEDLERGRMFLVWDVKGGERGACGSRDRGVSDVLSRCSELDPIRKLSSIREGDCMNFLISVITDRGFAFGSNIGGGGSSGGLGRASG